MGQQWTTAGAGALDAVELGIAQALLEKVAINPTIETPELTQDCGNRLLEGKNKLVRTKTQEKGAVTPKETYLDLPVSIQESPAEVWVSGGQLQGWGN